MTQNTRIYNRFQGYSLEDCACKYCLHYSRKTGCKLSECCCAEEKRQALERERGVRIFGDTPCRA